MIRLEFDVRGFRSALPLVTIRPIGASITRSGPRRTGLRVRSRDSAFASARRTTVHAGRSAPESAACRVRGPSARDRRARGTRRGPAGPRRPRPSRDGTRRTNHPVAATAPGSRLVSRRVALRICPIGGSRRRSGLTRPAAFGPGPTRESRLERPRWRRDSPRGPTASNPGWASARISRSSPRLGNGRGDCSPVWSATASARSGAVRSSVSVARRRHCDCGPFVPLRVARRPRGGPTPPREDRSGRTAAWTRSPAGRRTTVSGPREVGVPGLTCRRDYGGVRTALPGSVRRPPSAGATRPNRPGTASTGAGEVRPTVPAANRRAARSIDSERARMAPDGS